MLLISVSFLYALEGCFLVEFDFVFILFLGIRICSFFIVWFFLMSSDSFPTSMKTPEQKTYSNLFCLYARGTKSSVTFKQSLHWRSVSNPPTNPQGNVAHSWDVSDCLILNAEMGYHEGAKLCNSQNSLLRERLSQTQKINSDN